MKKLLGLLLGAGQGFIGTVVRTSLAALGGILVAKGYLSAESAATLTTQLAGAVGIVLAAVGSILNNSAP